MAGLRKDKDGLSMSFVEEELLPEQLMLGCAPSYLAGVDPSEDQLAFAETTFIEQRNLENLMLWNYRLKMNLMRQRWHCSFYSSFLAAKRCC